eukprot:Tbor_TRINITY_DN5156_c0_g1::TRINITY_DN5156_c0_g1_i1::g.25616::m.25616
MFAIRWLLTTVLFQTGVIYAAYLALRTPEDKRVLKLTITIGIILLVSHVATDIISYVIPMFLELRSLSIWAIVILEPIAWDDLYDNCVGPIFTSITEAFRELVRSCYVKQVLLLCVQGTLMIAELVINIAVTSGAFKNPEKLEHAIESIRREIDDSKVGFPPLPTIPYLL